MQADNEQPLLALFCGTNATCLNGPGGTSVDSPVGRSEFQRSKSRLVSIGLAHTISCVASYVCMEYYEQLVNFLL